MFKANNKIVAFGHMYKLSEIKYWGMPSFTALMAVSPRVNKEGYE
jgi:hypothetical protein